jgi:hypothetical protein
VTAAPVPDQVRLGGQKALELLATAGFGAVNVHAAPGDPLDGVFVAQKEG